MTRLSRRQFLRCAGAAAGAALAAPYVVPSSARGADGTVSPSERITMAIMGCGPRGTSDMGHFLRQADVRFLAACDCREQRRMGAKEAIDKTYGDAGCAVYHDFREMFARPDLDAVLIATGDRWHALGSIYAARAGKDVYSEKPIGLTIADGRAVVETFRRYGGVYQAGFQRHSVDSYRFQTEVAKRGLIGKVHTILAQVWEYSSVAPQASKPVPPGFDYDMWLGPTPWHPYTDARVNGWRVFWDTSNGNISDMGSHYCDIAQWGNATEHTGPAEVEGVAEWFPDAMSDTPRTCTLTYTYANGVKFVLDQRGQFNDRFIRFTGDEGWIQVDDATNNVTAHPASILKLRGISARGWGDLGDHARNFLTAVKTREPTVCHPELAHRAQTIPCLGSICLRLGRKLRWNPDAEQFVGDAEADNMIARAPRAPWHL